MDVSGQRQLGSRVREARTAAGLSLRETARRIGVSPATLSAVENGRTGVSVPRLKFLAAELGTTVPWLINEPDLARRLAPGPQTTTAHATGVDTTDPAATGSHAGQPGAAADATKPGAITFDSTTPRATAPRENAPHAPESGHEPDLPSAWREFPTLDIDPVLAAAIASFVETGYHGATMRSIAQRAGMSVPGVYHHYRDKQQLLVRALDLTMDELHHRVRTARVDAGTGRDRVIRTVEALALFHTHRRELAFIGASEMRSLEPANRRRITNSRNEIQYLLDADIDAALTEARLPTDHARAAGRAIATMCTALPQWFRLDGPASPEQIATEYADFALGLLGLR
ncbi:TetR family transcriptional regulator [Nocardia mangyaensis]|uniref:TetR family transcriptional regulator n=1 Tax=Nocardia mangyaensis TaxID=2213200 RepID=UPI002676C7E1|nr:TetR family transcriptional regulator [Nocardia mangyaensis]MDO3648312.1 TetR family transcriptional regulator [Nocardia mangyaensis]